MASYGDVLAALRDYRNALERERQAEVERRLTSDAKTASAFAVRGGVAAFTTPLTNIHATGVGVRVRGGKIVPGDFVIKVYVFDKCDLGDAAPELTKRFGDIEIDVEPLPIQQALATRPAMDAEADAGGSGVAVAAAADPQRIRHRPIVGGLSIAPLNEPSAGTLGCFVRRVSSGTQQIFALSNNHVLADANRLPLGTSIVQPGAEIAHTGASGVFAALSEFVPIQFPTCRATPVSNRIDAAIAVVSDVTLIEQATIFGIANYVPELATPMPAMNVIKCGRTTGVTTGVITSTSVRGVQVNYGTRTAPRLTVFDDTIEIIGDNGPFSDLGDSGAVVLEADTGRPVALLFAGDGFVTTACDLGSVCQRFQVVPV
jgi:hypothetical protein